MAPPTSAPEPSRLPRRRRRLARALLGAFLCFALGGVAGFLCFTRVLPAWLAAEAEPALAVALGGPVTISSLRPALRLGLAFEAKGVEAWPAAPGPALRVGRVVAHLSSAALARRRLRVHRVELDGVELRLARARDGILEPEVFERWLHGRDVGATTRAPVLPRRIEVRDAHVSFADGDGPLWLVAVPALALAIERAGGLALALEAAVAHASPEGGEAQRVADATLSARLGGGEPGTASLSFSGLALEAVTDRGGPLTHFFRGGPLEPGLRGSASGTASLTLAPGIGAADAPLLVASTWQRASGELALALRAKRLRVPAGSGRDAGDLAFENAFLRGRIGFAPGGFAFRDASVEADGLALAVEGALARPVSAEASLALKLAAPELTAASARTLATALPARARRHVEPVLARVEAGSLRRLAAHAAGPLERWQALLRGERGALAHGFSEPPGVSLESGGLALRLDDGHRLEAIRGRISLRGDTLQVRELAGRHDGDPTDELDVDLDGVSALLDAHESDPGAARSSDPLAGRRPIAQLLERPRGSEPSWRALALEVDRLAHALLAWPVVEARAVATPRTGGFHVVLERARWGGVPVRGEADVFDGPPARLHVSLVAGAGADAAQQTAGTAPESAGSPPETPGTAPENAGALPDTPGTAPERASADRESWARGRYRLDLVVREGDRVERVEGYFRANGPKLRLFESSAALAPGGRLRGDAELDLSQSDAVPFDTRFALDQASAADLIALVARPNPEARGAVEVRGELTGRLAPGHPLLAGARGRARLEARDGELPTQLPFFLYLASASAGLNPFASRDRVAYRKIKGDFTLADDRLATENLELHGPDMRIGATGSLGIPAPHEVQSVVVVALRGNVSRTIGAIPLVGYLMLGRDKSLVSLWFHLKGPWETARATLIPVKSLAVGPAGIVTEGLPKFIERGIDALAELLGRDEVELGGAAPGAAAAQELVP